MAYTVTLTLHSYLRWLLLIAGVVVLVRSFSGWFGKRDWNATDQRAQVGFMAVLDTQLLIGLLLYFVLSPITAAFFANPKASMKISSLRFFGVEHLTMMLIGVIIVHVARIRGKRMTDGTSRHRLTAWTTLVWLILTLGTIPWPGLAWGRPLFRSF